MKIEKEAIENHQMKIKAEFDQETFDRFKVRSARKLAKDNKVPGFRPGKAPYNIIASMFGEDHIEQHAVEMMLDDVYPKVLEEAEINPSGPGSLDEIIQVNPPILSFIVPLEPEVELFDYKSIRKDYQPVSVTESEIDEVLENLRNNYSTAQPVERAAQEGDLVAIKLVGMKQDEKVYDTSTQVVIGENRFGPDTWPFEGFSKRLIGLKESEEKEFEFHYSDDEENERVKGSTVVFNVVVDGVKEIVLPELDDEFAKSLGQYETYQEMLDSVKTNLEKQKIQGYDQEFVGEIIEEIVTKSTIKYPPNVLDNQVHQVVHSLEDDLAKQNLDLSAYLKARNLEEAAFIEKEVTPVAKKRLEQSLVMEKIGKEENITVDPTELEPLVTQSMQQLQRTPGFEKHTNRNALNRFANAVTFDAYNRLYNQHTLDRLRDIAAGKVDAEASEHPVSPAESTSEGTAEDAADPADSEPVENME